MNSKKILIVEDELIIAGDLQHELEAAGFRVTGTATSGEEALELVARETPDLVLMDIILQGNMNGVETASILKERYNIPVIFLTAYADSFTFDRAKELLPFGYILKPFQARELIISVELAIHRAESEKTISRLREKITSMEKLLAIESFTASIAHDLKNILAPIRLFTENGLTLLAENSQTYPRQELIENLEKTQYAVLLANELVGRINRLSMKQEDGQDVVCDLAEVTRNTVQVYSASRGNKIRFQLNIPQGLANARISPIGVSQILLNLLSNADHAVEKTDKPQIDVTLSTLDPVTAERETAGRLSCACHKLTVSDNGCGITPELLQTIFDPFIRIREEHSGSGLGLTIVQALTERAKGYLTATSEPERGSVFSVFLPAVT